MKQHKIHKQPKDIDLSSHMSRLGDTYTKTYACMPLVIIDFKWMFVYS